MKIKIKKHTPDKKERYIPLSDIEEIDNAYLSEMERVRRRLTELDDPDIITKFQEVLLSAYSAEIELRTREREVDYAIKLAEIEQRERNLKPWRRCWLWRLLLRPLTNRAQDIIEAKAELEADIHHTDEEEAIEAMRKNLPEQNGKKPSARKLKRRMRDKLEAVIKAADKADMHETFDEPSTLPSLPEPEPAPAEQSASGSASPAATVQKPPQLAGQLPGQMTIDNLTTPQTFTAVRRPRPPKSCRKQ